MSKLKGTNVAAPIVPFDSNDTYPTHDDQYGIGGFRSVQTISDRNNIPDERKRPGMRVYVWGESDPSNNTDWEWNYSSKTWIKSKVIADAESILSQAEDARDEAIEAKDSTLNNVKIFPSTFAGISATNDGEFFNVPSTDDNIYLSLYKNNSGVAEKIKDYPSYSAIEDLIYTVKNTLYVTKNGDDSNEGDSLHSPFATINHAFNVINSRREVLGETGYDPEPYVVIVHPGHYEVNAETVIPRNTTLYGYDLRSTTISIGDTDEPANMFKMTNGIKVRGFTFLGLKHETQFDPGGDPSHNLKSVSEIKIGGRYKISTDGYVFSGSDPDDLVNDITGKYRKPNWSIGEGLTISTPSSTKWQYFIEEDWESSTNEYSTGYVFTAIRSGSSAVEYDKTATPEDKIVGNGSVYDLDGIDYPPKKGWVFTFQPEEFITRSPYLADCSQLHNFTYEQMSLPIDRTIGNPDMPRSGGNMWADGSVLDKYSPLKSVVVDSFTAINPNGYGYLVDKNALVQLVSIFTNWSRYGIWANQGGHVTLANSNNTFGDYALVSSGYRWIISLPEESISGIGEYDDAADYIKDATESLYVIGADPDVYTMDEYASNDAIVWDNLLTNELNEIPLITEMWNKFISQDSFSYEHNGKTYRSDYRSSYSNFDDNQDDNYTYYEMWFDDYIELFDPSFNYQTQPRYEFHTKRDAKSLLNQLSYDLKSGQDRAIRFFANGVFDWDGTPFFLVNDQFLTSANEVFNKGLLDKYLTKYNANLWSSFRRCFIIYYQMFEDLSKEEGSPFTEGALTAIRSLLSFLIDIFDDIYKVYAGDGSSPPVDYVSEYRKGIPSTIEATGQQFSYSGTGVNYNSLPYAQRGSGVSPDPTSTLLKYDGGQIFATFSSESGDTYLGEDLKVDFNRSTIEGQAFSRGVQNIALPLIIGVSG